MMTALDGQNIRHETYYSELMGVDVGYNIHIPANYDPEDTSKRYPVLYFLHPLGGNENSWVSNYWGATYVEVLQEMGDDMFIVYVNNASDQWYTDAANAYYAQEGIYAVYEKNKDRIAEEGLNIIMRWGEIDPVALISNQKMYDLLAKNEGIAITKEIIEGYDHSGVYYDGRVWDNLKFHKSNLDFSGTEASAKEYKIGSVNTSLGDVFVEKGSSEFPDDAKLIVVSYGEDNSLLDCQVVEVSNSVKTDFEPVADADYVKVFIWSMGDITPVCASKTEDIL